MGHRHLPSAEAKRSLERRTGLPPLTAGRAGPEPFTPGSAGISRDQPRTRTPPHPLPSPPPRRPSPSAVSRRRAQVPPLPVPAEGGVPQAGRLGSAKAAFGGVRADINGV